VRDKIIRIMLIIMIGAGSLQAVEEIPDDLQVRLGGYFITSQDTEMRLKGKNRPGVYLNLQDLLNMESSTQVFRLDGYYRFTPHHSLEVSWYSIKNKGRVDGGVEVPLGDYNLSASGRLDSTFNTDIYKVNYLYSFYHNEQVELAIGAGLHVMRFALGFDGEYSFTGIINEDGGGTSDNVAVTAPLPVAGFRVSYKILPELRVKYAADYFFIAFDGSTGGLVDTLLTVDYRITKNFGLGLGVNSTRMRLETELESARVLTINYDIIGGMVYGTLNF